MFRTDCCCCVSITFVLFFFFFFQAEDGIRDLYVTGVQMCALPILRAIRSKFWCAPWIRSTRQSELPCVAPCTKCCQLRVVRVGRSVFARTARTSAERCAATCRAPPRPLNACSSVFRFSQRTKVFCASIFNQ